MKNENYYIAKCNKCGYCKIKESRFKDWSGK